MTPSLADTATRAKKTAARKAAQARRRAAFDAPDRAARVAAAAAHLRAALEAALGADGASCTLAGYAPMRSELDPMPAMHAHRGRLCLPVIVARGAPLKFRDWVQGAALIEGTFGALIPAQGAWVRPRALIVPLLAFDDAGFRLGYGGGFYDRTLQALRNDGPVLALGYAFDAQREPSLPVENTDQQLDGVVTETGVRWIAPQRPG